MRSNLLGCARLGVVAMLTVGCSHFASGPHPKVPATVMAKCTGNQITFVVNPSTVHFKHTGIFKGPTDAVWSLDDTSSVDSVVVAAKSSTWPFDGSTTFAVRKNAPQTGVGKDKQDAGIYRYTVTVTCPNGGPIAIFDPDVWVD